MKLRFCLSFLFLALISCGNSDEQPQPEFINITLIFPERKFELGESIPLSAEIESNVPIGKYELDVFSQYGSSLFHVEEDNLNEKTISIEKTWQGEERGWYILSLMVFSQDHSLEESKFARIVVF